jgi:hypothetical protein
MTNNAIARLGASLLALAAATGAAQADAGVPAFMGDPVIAIGVIVVLVAIIWLIIRGALGIAARDKSDEDESGVGILEGIDEDEDKPKRR